MKKYSRLSSAVFVIGALKVKLISDLLNRHVSIKIKPRDVLDEILNLIESFLRVFLPALLLLKILPV